MSVFRPLIPILLAVALSAAAAPAFAETKSWQGSQSAARAAGHAAFITLFDFEWFTGMFGADERAVATSGRAYASPAHDADADAASLE
ncbi:MAG: hypothetical protein ACFB3T_03150 [Geminicoccaceae bacterium]